jgi:hypothetical protein
MGGQSYDLSPDLSTDVTELAASLSPVIAHEFGSLAKLASYSDPE